MFTLIDRYIFKKFVSTFIFCMLLFTLVAIAVDSSEHTDDFVKSGLSTKEIIKQYYLGFIPWIWGLLYPLFVFIAVIFFTSKMATRSEIVAILANGVTFNRWLRPYFITGVLFAGGLWYASRYTIPRANEVKSNFNSKYLDNTNSSQQSPCSGCFYRRIDSVTYVGLKNYDTASKSGGPVFLEKIRNGTVFYNLRAVRLEWDTAKKDWKLISIVERTIDSMKEHLRNLDTMHIDLKIQPRELRRDDYLKDKLTTPELSHYIEAEEARGTEGLNVLKVEQHRRTATPFSVLLLTMIGAIIAGRKTRGGSGVHLALGFIIAALFIVSDRFSTVFSVKGNVPPLIAAWLPNMVFTLVAIRLYFKAPK